MSKRAHDVANNIHSASLNRLIAAVQRRWGTRALRRGVGGGGRLPLATSLAALDTLLDGGLPRGAITECLGAPTSGMTTLALTALAHAQAHGEPVAYIDAGGMFDAGYAAACGVVLSDLILARPNNAANTLALIEALIASGEFGILIVDSLVGSSSGAVSLSTALRRFAPALAQTPTALVALTFFPAPVPAAHVLAGHGSALAHAAALRLYIARHAWDVRAGGDIACMAQVTVLKRRGAADGAWVQLPITFPRDWDAP